MEDESLDIPQAVRDAVYDRDQGYCRVCGEFLKNPGLHHIEFGGSDVGMGGRRVHDPATIVTVGWRFPDRNCHLTVHEDKSRWQDLLLLCARYPGRTALQLERWAERMARETG